MDAGIILVAYFIAFSARTASTPDLKLGAEFMTFVVALTLICLYLSGGYHRLWTRTSGHDVTVIVRATLGAVAIITAANYAIEPRPLPTAVVLVGHTLALIGFVTVRYRSRVISGATWRWRAIWRREFPEQETRVLIIGAGDAGQTTAWRLKHRAPAGSNYRVVGLIDDDPAKQHLYVEGSEVLGTRADIPRIVAAYNVDLIVVAVHNITGPDFRDVLGYCERTKARLKVMPDVFAVITADTGTTVLRDIQPEDLLGRQAVGWHEGVDVSPVSQKVVLVTGAAGSIGSELCRQMLKYDPVKLILLDNNESGLHDLVTELITEENRHKLVPVLADITSRPVLERVYAQHHPRVIFHAAAYKHVPMLEDYPDESIRVNVGGTRQLAELAMEFGAERFVLISTDKAVNPSSVMGASKRVCELIMHALAEQCHNSTLYSSVRFGNVLNSRGSVVPTFNRQIDAGGPVTVTDPDMFRYFMTIPEAVNLVIHAACLTKGDDLFMLQMGDEVRILDLAERMIRMRGLRPYIDIPIEFTGVRPGEKLHEELHDHVEQTVPTIHPGIMQLVTSTNGRHVSRFMERVTRLTNEGLCPNSDPLEQLRAIIIDDFAQSRAPLPEAPAEPGNLTDLAQSEPVPAK